MPISTRLAKSMPSTNARKPWTKCCRDCSPSVTMSMPASSCSLMAMRVASRLPASRSSPASRHGAHSLLGSASQDGLGRLPAMLVSNIFFLFTFSFSAWALRGFAPPVDPVILREDTAPAKGGQRGVAHQGGGSTEMIDLVVAACRALHLRRARLALALVIAQRPGGIVRKACQRSRQHERVFDRHGGALGEE